MEATRVSVAWEPRPDGLEASAQQLLAAIYWLRSLSGIEGPFTAVPPAIPSARPESATLPCETQEEAERCIDAGAQLAEPGAPGATPVLYRQCFFLGPFRAWRAKIVLVCGVRAPVPGVEVPNRFDVLIKRPLSPAEVRQALVGLIGVYRPVYGLAGSERYPGQDANSTGGASVGWLAYLSSWFGPPLPLRAPVLVSPMGRLGTLYQAFPEAFDEGREEHRQQVRALEAALRAGGALRPHDPTAAAAR